MNDLCRALGAQVAQTPPPPSGDALHHLDAVFQQCKELIACGTLQQQAFLSGLSQQQQLSPLQLVLAYRLFGLQVVQQLLPSPQQAATLIQQAAASQEVCLSLVISSQSLPEQQQQKQPAALSALLNLLKALLLYTFDAAAVAAADSPHTARAWSGGAQASCGCDSSLQQYVMAVLEQLHEAAADQQVLAVCLVRAAASCGVLCDSGLVERWASSMLLRQIQACFRPPVVTAAGSAVAATPSPPAPQASPALAHNHSCSSSWPCLALQPLCWALLMPPVLQCMRLQSVLDMLRDNLALAAGSVTGIMGMCDMLAALQTCGHADRVAAMLSDSLASALTAGDAHSSLVPLLLAAHLLMRGDWDKRRYQALLQAAAMACLGSSHAATAVPVLLKAVNLLLPTSEQDALQAQVEVLQQLRAHVGPVLLADVSSTVTTLKDVLLQKQQMLKLEQQGRQGGKVIERTTLDGYQQFLDLFIAHGRRPLAPVDIARWRLMRGAQDVCDAFTQQPPDTLDRAQACLCYIQELQTHRLCKATQVEEYKAACSVFGLDLSAAQQRSRGSSCNPAAAATTPLDSLKSLLDRLPVVVASGSKPGLAALLSRLSQQVQGVLKASTSNNNIQQQQQQQQQQAQPSGDAGASHPPAKKARLQLPPAARASSAASGGRSTAPTAGGASGAAGVNPSPADVLDMLLSAYAAASGSGSSAAAGRDWRVEFLGVLAQQGPQELHTPLLQRLLGSLHGTAWPAAVAPQQALFQGSLTAWLAACKPHQLPLLAGDAGGAGGAEATTTVTTALSAVPLFTWRCGSSTGGDGDAGAAKSSSAAAGGAGDVSGVGAGRLQGLQLVQCLLGHTSLDTVHGRCCAASFWAGYVGCVKTSLGQWCAGPHGAFGSTATTSSSPGALTLASCTQMPTASEASEATLGQQQQLLAYVPHQLAVLLRQLVSDLSADVQQAAGGEASAVAASALQVCTRALRTPAMKWVCQRYGV